MIKRPTVYPYFSHACDPYCTCIQLMLKFNAAIHTACCAAIHSPEHLSPCEVMWGQTLSRATRKQQCASKFSSNAGKVQRLPWQAGKNIGKMNCEHSNCSSLSCFKRPGQFDLGLVEQGGRGLWVALEVTRLDGLFAANLSDSKAHGLPSSLKSVFPPEGQRAVGQSLSCKGMALTNQPPSAFSSATAWHAKQQLIESLVHFGFTSAAALLLFVLFVCLCSTHRFSVSYVLIQSNTHLDICEVTLTLIFHWLLFLNSHSKILTLNSTFLTWTSNSLWIFGFEFKPKEAAVRSLPPYSNKTASTHLHWDYFAHQVIRFQAFSIGFPACPLLWDKIFEIEDPANGDVRRLQSKEIKSLRAVAITTVCQKGLIKVVYYLMLLSLIFLWPHSIDLYNMMFLIIWKIHTVILYVVGTSMSPFPPKYPGNRGT